MRGSWRKLMWWPCVPSRSPQGSLTGQALTSFPYQPQFKHSAIILRLELWNATTLLAKECLTEEPKEKAKHVDFRLRPLRLCGSPKVVTSVQLVELHITVLVQQRRIHNLYQHKMQTSWFITSCSLLKRCRHTLQWNWIFANEYILETCLKKTAHCFLLRPHFVV